MGEQNFRGTLASGGTFIADGRGVRILDPAGNQLASFGRDVISGIQRDGQVVTIERHSDTIVTLTTASITDAVGLEQYVRDTITAPMAAPPPPIQPEPEGAPPLAFDAIDDDAPAEAPPPRPPIISRPDPTADGEVATPSPHDLPEPVPTTPRSSFQADADPVAPIPPVIPVQSDATDDAVSPAPSSAGGDAAEEGGGRRLWLWGCLGCGGLIILSMICSGVLVGTGVIDVDELTGDDETPTPFVIVATREDGSSTEEDQNSVDPTPTAITDGGGGADASPTESGSSGGDTSPTAPLDEDLMQAGESGTLEGMEVTFVGSRTSDSGLIDPDEGNEYLILEFELTNTTADAIVVSSLLQFELSDGSDTEFSVALFADVETTLDTEVPAGETVRGEVAFEVEQGGGPYTIAYTDFFTEDALQWQVS